LTRAEFGVLRALRAIGEPYELRPTDLKARILLTSGGTTNVLNRLVASGLIERERDDTDGRSSWVRLTQKGLVTAEETIVSWSQAQSDIYRGVPPETMQVAADALREVLLAIGDHDLPAPNRRDSDRSRGRRASAGRDAARAASRTRTPSSPH
jgi:DNA-binding MarR family transcriptional regulator